MSKQPSPTPIVIGFDIDNTLILSQLYKNLFQRFTKETMEKWLQDPYNEKMADLTAQICSDPNYIQILALLEAFKKRITRLQQLAKLSDTPLVIIFPTAKPELDFATKCTMKFLEVARIVDKQGKNGINSAVFRKKTLSSYPRYEHQFLINNMDEKIIPPPEVKRASIIFAVDEKTEGPDIPLNERDGQAANFLPAIQIFNPTPALEDPDDPRFARLQREWAAGQSGLYRKSHIFAGVKSFFAPQFNMNGRMIILDDQPDVVEEIKTTAQGHVHCVCIEELKQPSLSLTARLAIVNDKLDQIDNQVISILLADITKQILEVYHPDLHSLGQTFLPNDDINKLLNIILNTLITQLSGAVVIHQSPLTALTQLQQELTTLVHAQDNPQQINLQLPFIIGLQSSILATYTPIGDYTLHRTVLRQISFVMICRLINNSNQRVKALIKAANEDGTKTHELVILNELNSLHNNLYRILTRMEAADIPATEKIALYAEFRQTCQQINLLIAQRITPVLFETSSDIYQATIQLQQLGQIIGNHIRPDTYAKLKQILPHAVDAKQVDTAAVAALQYRDPTHANFDDEQRKTDQQLQFVQMVQDGIKLDDTPSKKAAAAQLERHALTQLIRDVYEEIKWEKDEPVDSLTKDAAPTQMMTIPEECGLQRETGLQHAFKFIFALIERFDHLQQKKSLVNPSELETLLSEEIYIPFRHWLETVEKLQKETAHHLQHQQTMKKLVKIGEVVRNHIRPESFKQLDRLCFEKFRIPPSHLSLASQAAPSTTAVSTSTVQINGKSVAQTAIHTAHRQRNHFVALADPTSHQFYVRTRPNSTRPRTIKRQEAQASYTTFSTQLTKLRREIYPRQNTVGDIILRILEKIANTFLCITENLGNYNSARFLPGLRKTKHQQQVDNVLAPVAIPPREVPTLG